MLKASCISKRRTVNNSSHPKHTAEQLPTNNRLRDLMTTQARRLAEIDGQLPLALATAVMRAFERSRSSAAKLSSQKRTSNAQVELFRF
jgi:hypothetical protein